MTDHRTDSKDEGLPYEPPKISSVRVAPDITKCMQNTGGIEPCSTFRKYLDVRKAE